MFNMMMSFFLSEELVNQIFLFYISKGDILDTLLNTKLQSRSLIHFEIDY